MFLSSTQCQDPALYGIQDVRFETVPMRQREHDNEVIIRVQTAGICASDISRFGKIGSYNPGLTGGREFAGLVIAIRRSVLRVKSGDRMVACPCFPCWNCEYCCRALQVNQLQGSLHEISGEAGKKTQKALDFVCLGFSPLALSLLIVVKD
ncbi:alcohol dehydrogenase-like protein [Rahnella sp. BIGb0236]|uniref:alcohol dehydrogenase catalytic domain-containing protein n=1 Tax=Rahnella TaxID=34037 RepID=UPI000BB17EED|nr:MULTISPECIES: alcohol dehydrogenase catalytic domain-containing protein [Rahnella]TDS98253.1 alcohol dehydrogenase-like protein [Rahnella sp. BIGb0236]VTQ52130.1 oxidoreductase, zinc-binding dehydrogenase family [Campylobacter jejuni]